MRPARRSRRDGFRRRPDPGLDARRSGFASPSVSLDDAYDWIDRQGPDSPDLLEAIAAVDDGVLSLIPYLYQPTVRGLHLAKVPALLQAATHPEPPLRLPVFDELFSAADALLHGSRAEQQLVLERFPSTASTPQTVLGYPVEIDGPVDPDAARHALGLGDEPFCVYLCRVDAGKGVLDLVERFRAFRQRRGGGRLVIAGPVIDKPPVVDGVDVLGRIPTEHKFGLLAAADVLINPSPHESFSCSCPRHFSSAPPRWSTDGVCRCASTVRTAMAGSGTPDRPTSTSPSGDCSMTHRYGIAWRLPGGPTSSRCSPGMPCAPGGRASSVRSAEFAKIRGRQRPHRPVDPDDEVGKQTDGESLEHGEAEQHSVGSRAEVLVDKVVTELADKDQSQQ